MMDLEEVAEVARYIKDVYDICGKWDQAQIEGLHYAKINFGTVADTDKMWIFSTARSMHLDEVNNGGY